MELNFSQTPAGLVSMTRPQNRLMCYRMQPSMNTSNLTGSWNHSCDNFGTHQICWKNFEAFFSPPGSSSSSSAVTEFIAELSAASSHFSCSRHPAVLFIGLTSMYRLFLS